MNLTGNNGFKMSGLAGNGVGIDYVGSKLYLTTKRKPTKQRHPKNSINRTKLGSNVSIGMKKIQKTLSGYRNELSQVAKKRYLVLLKRKPAKK